MIPKPLTEAEFKQADYVQRIIQVIGGVLLSNYQVDLHIVSPQFGGLWKFKLRVSGKGKSMTFDVTLPMLDSYEIAELAAVVVKRAKQEHIEPFNKQPYAKYGTLPAYSYGKSKHPTTTVGKHIDLAQVVRMTCCKSDNMITGANGVKYWTYTLQEAIIHLNDQERWTREQIADWLETQDIDISFG